MEVDGQERGFVTPVFEEALRRRRRQRIKRRAVVGAQPREQRQVMRADEHVDAVDLEQAKPPDSVRQRGGADVRVAAQCVESLRRERDAPGLGERKFFLQRQSPGIVAATDRIGVAARCHGSVTFGDRAVRIDGNVVDRLLWRSTLSHEVFPVAVLRLVLRDVAEKSFAILDGDQFQGVYRRVSLVLRLP